VGKTRPADWRESLSSFSRGFWVLLLAASLFLLLPASGHGNPAVQSRRLIGYQQVDLSPLFFWWEQQKGVRPLQAWKHVQGSLERPTVYGWMVRGSIEGQSGLQYFLLKNPPTTTMARYKELNDQLPKLQQERASTLAVTRLPAYVGWAYDDFGRTVRVPSEDFERIEEAKHRLQEIDHDIAAVRQQIGGMLNREGYLRVDAFALQLNDQYQGSPVLDCGFPRW
jgi:hypothetical protein